MKTAASAKEVISIASVMADVVPHLPFPIASLATIKVFWNDECGGNGTLGRCSPIIEPDTVCLSGFLRGQWKHSASTLCHELRHIHQRRRMGAFLFTLASIPVIRRFTLEASAWSNERVADELLGFKGLNSDEIPFF